MQTTTIMMGDKVAELRQTYRACLKLADETDSKKEDMSLRNEATLALQELKKICPHDHIVCLRSEYEGSYTDDYDDAHPEDRICVCCGVIESAYLRKNYGKGFQVLTKNPLARFEGGIYQTGGGSIMPPEMKSPLSFLLTECVEVAETKGHHYFVGR